MFPEVRMRQWSAASAMVVQAANWTFHGMCHLLALHSQSNNNHNINKNDRDEAVSRHAGFRCFRSSGDVGGIC